VVWPIIEPARLSCAHAISLAKACGRRDEKYLMQHQPVSPFI
jgi:hypothetical protein